MLDYEHMTVINETMTFINKMLSFHTLCNTAALRRCRRQVLFCKIQLRPRSCRSYLLWWRPWLIWWKISSDLIRSEFWVRILHYIQRPSCHNSDTLWVHATQLTQALGCWYQMDQTGHVRQRGRRIVLARNGAMPSSLGRQNASAIAECRGHANVHVKKSCASLFVTKLNLGLFWPFFGLLGSFGAFWGLFGLVWIVLGLVGTWIASIILSSMF